MLNPTNNFCRECRYASKIDSSGSGELELPEGYVECHGRIPPVVGMKTRPGWTRSGHYCVTWVLVHINSIACPDFKPLGEQDE